MSTSIRFLRLHFPLIFNPTLRKTLFNGAVISGTNRFMFTETPLGLPGYKQARLQVSKEFNNLSGTFREKMKDIVEKDSNNIFTEDLKAMVHLVEKDPEDIKLLIKMIHKFNSQNNELRFGNFIFGPVVMRAFYYLNEPDVALSTFVDKNLEAFFEQWSSYLILMTLLYNNGKYSAVRELYVKFIEQPISVKSNSDILLITAAGCYKENTEEALNFLIDQWNSMGAKDARIVRRISAFLGALAVKQNKPIICLEIDYNKMSRYIDNRCVRLLAYCKLDRAMDVLRLLSSSVTTRKERYFCDVIEEVKAYVETENDTEIKKEISHILDVLKSEVLIEDLTMEEHLLKPIDRRMIKRNKQTVQSNFNAGVERTAVSLKDLL